MCYLLENNFNTEEAMVSFDKADSERAQAVKQAEEEGKAQQEAEKQARLEEIEKMEQFISEQSQYVSQDEKEIVANIFLSMYGDKSRWNYSFVALIHNFDNPYCKDMIISQLHNYNKASIKIFECITGLKLPKSYKERAAFLKSITKADFKEMVKYKPGKKRNTDTASNLNH